MANSKAKSNGNGYSPSLISGIALFGVKIINKGVKGVEKYVANIDVDAMENKIGKGRRSFSKRIHKVAKYIESQNE